MWQLPPAGSVDAGAVAPDGAVDLRRQLLAELAEELGLRPDDVDEPAPLCVVEHPGSHVCDLGMALRTKLSGDEVCAARERGGNREYQELAVVPLAQLDGFVAQTGSALVPPAQVFLQRAGLLPGPDERGHE
jgi:hypothetical protein